MFLLVSVCHVGAHPGGHQHGVSIQISINLGKIFLRISCIRNILQKNNLQLARAALFFVHFLAVVVVAMWNFLSSCTFCGENVLCAHKKFWCLFSCSLFFFFLLQKHIFTLLTASISHFLTAATKFSCYFSNEIRLLCFFVSRSFRLACRLPLVFFVFLFLYIPNLWTWKLIYDQYSRQHGHRNNFRYLFCLPRSLFVTFPY